jgi:hypothetical protein
VLTIFTVPLRFIKLAFILFFAEELSVLKA